MKNQDIGEIFEWGQKYTLGETEFAYLGRNISREYLFATLPVRILEPTPEGEIEIVALRGGSFISDGIEVILFENPEYNIEKRRLTEIESLAYFSADQCRYMPNPKTYSQQLQHQ